MEKQKDDKQKEMKSKSNNSDKGETEKKEQSYEHKKTIAEDAVQKKENVDTRDQKILELTDSLQRMQAEMQNFKKRCEKENSDFKSYVSAEMACKLLPILDSFELALKNSEKHEEFVKGVELIFGQLYDILGKEGLRPIPTIGEKFNPYKHEVLLTEKTDDEKEDELIVEELQKGFMFKDKVLRYSKVKIKKK